MAQPGPSDYRSLDHTSARERPAEAIIDQVSQSARELGSRAGSMAEELAVAIKERPYTTLAVAAGLAFALGAVWKLGHRQPPSRLQSLLAQLPEMPTRESLLGRWR